MYQALYRKYRPVDFDSVVGQNAIVRTLKNSVVRHNFSHAYMFFGPRGTGKTTISKIFARNINCLNPIDGRACGECEACKISFSKNCMDILEIDAASNNGVDEIRDLKSKITLVPNDLKYKVYIIDEVHMLSIGAFNALLKTLEEPPEHAIFILATTDPQKVPETIVSRCQCFSFKKISVDTIFDRLSFVCKEEKIKIDEEVLKNISYLSDGGMRDALGMLDKLVSYTDKKITMDDFEEVNGIVSNDVLYQFLEYILLGNIKEVLSNIQSFEQSGKNLIQIFTQLLIYSRNLIVDYYLKNKEISFSLNLFQSFINLINEKMFDIKKSDNTRIYIEMLLLKFINDSVLQSRETSVNEEPNIATNVSEKEKAIEKKDKKVSAIVSTSVVEKDDDYVFSKEYGDDEDNISVDIMSPSSLESFSENVNLNDFHVNITPKVKNITDIMNVRINNTLALADKNLLKEEEKNFEMLKDYTFDQKIGYLVCSLLDSKIRVVSPENMIISYEYDSNVSQNLVILDQLMDVYKTITKSDKRIAILSDLEWNKVREKYIENMKKGISYQVQEEPKEILEEEEKNDIITNSAVELFGDIVEIE